jgi:hypothetical protein
MSKKSPRRAVCCVVLNLQNAGWDCLQSFCLGQSLSHHSWQEQSRFLGVGSKPVMQHHAHSRVSFLYHV